MVKKAQASSEYLILMGFVLAVIIPIILYFFHASAETNTEIRSQQVQDIVDLIIEKADSAYYRGEPTKHTIEANFPDGIEGITINTNEIQICFVPCQFVVSTHGN